MRTSPTQEWMPVEAVQYSTLAGPLSRTWYARIKIGPLWEPIDAMAARARINLHYRQFSAVLYFNAIGQMVDFVTEDRYRTVGKGQEQTRWSTPLRRYREVNGLRIATEGGGVR
jgi:hypothetical protein